MNLNQRVLQSVAFIGIKKEGSFTPRATAFFVRYTDGTHHFNHVVTAEHVVSGLLTAGHEIWLRINLVDGGTWESKMDHSAFCFHPEAERSPTDVAVSPINIPFINNAANSRADVLTLPINGPTSFVAKAEWAQRYIGLGTEVAAVGLFRSHYGKSKNVPVIRVGNISAMPTEPVFTKYAGYLEAYLIEARSIAGLSGSPVFVVPDPAEFIAEGLANKGDENFPTACLLGLMHGHFDVRNLNEDVVTEDDMASPSGIHTGMGVVIPVHKIVETINHPDLAKSRKAIVDQPRTASESANFDAAEATNEQAR
ncbi:hypothetical protein [Bauldia litoralis]|uniref:hypothetical protein n=1 Tax=Bauldia litoralis TaxID=665467 RepID=UPI0032648A42